MDSEILSAIRTRSEADDIVADIERLRKSLYEDGERSFESTLRSGVRYWVADIIREETRNKDIEVKEYLDKLTEKISEMEEFKITLAFEPSSSGINMFLDYIRQNVHENLILEIDHDPTILGGTIISYKGKYHDFSLVRVFDEEFEQNIDQFLKLIEGDNKDEEVDS